MDYTNILSAVLAGGMSAQIVTLLWGNQLSKKREFSKWILDEKYKLFSELLAIVAVTPETQDSLDQWTYSIRSLTQRIHILFPDGTAPDDLATVLENVFLLAKEKKHGQDNNQWRNNMRASIRELRKQIALNLKPL